jgi:hypothetical protein
MLRPTISVKQLIEKIYRTFNFKDTGRMDDILEFIMEGIKEAYIHSAEEIVTDSFHVKDFKVKYPKYILGLVGIEDNNGAPALLWETREAFSNNKTFNDKTTNSPNLYFQIQPNYFKFTKTDVDIKITYSRYVLDCDGFPLIPDEEVIKEYLSWHVIYKLIIGNYNHPVISLEMADAKRTRYFAKAQNADIDTSSHKMEEIFDSVLIPITRTNNRTL